MRSLVPGPCSGYPESDDALPARGHRLLDLRRQRRRVRVELGRCGFRLDLVDKVTNTTVTIWKMAIKIDYDLERG